MSIGILLFFLFVLVANVAIGYMIAILLGIGPPDFRTAWAKIKLSVPSPLSHSGGVASHLLQVKCVVSFVTSLAGRFKKHTLPSSDDSELPFEQMATPPTVSPIPPVQKSSGNNPVNAEQPDSPP